MSGFGSFSPEAYAKLQEAYANQLSKAEEIEEAGVKIGQDTLGVETAPIRSAWLDKTGLWKYPDGKGDYKDKKQSPEDLLAALRNEAGDVEIPEEELDDEAAAAELDSLSEEELNALIEDILSEDEEEGEESDDEEEEMSDEELDSLIDEILRDLDTDEEETQVSVEEEVEEEEVEDAISIAEKIAALKEELAALSASVDVEEVEEVSEEPTEPVEETDSQEQPVEEEEVTSDDEPA
jgi:hypothetical protein